jgi:hypothetical protein
MEVTSTIKDPIHTYTGADTSYTVKLIVTDTVGCAEFSYKSQVHSDQIAETAFDAVDTSSICPPLETKFFLHAQNYESYYWDFGDGRHPPCKHPKHFLQPHMNITMPNLCSRFGGCVDSLVKPISVHNPYTTPINYSPLESLQRIEC